MPAVQWGVVIGASAVAAAWDLARRRIPNVLTLPLWATGLVYAATAGGFAGLGDSAAASCLLAGPYVLLFLFAGGGGGDAKLMGAIGSWLGLVQGTVALLAVALSGVAVALAAMALRPRRSISGEPDSLKGVRTIPFGLAILLGVGVAGLAVLLWRR